jgi:hypothetical protein
MLKARDSASARLRTKLDHPVADADGHLLELIPLKFCASTNPEFFKGTRVEAAALLAAG